MAFVWKQYVLNNNINMKIVADKLCVQGFLRLFVNVGLKLEFKPILLLGNKEVIRQWVILRHVLE